MAKFEYEIIRGESLSIDEDQLRQYFSSNKGTNCIAIALNGQIELILMDTIQVVKIINSEGGSETIKNNGHELFELMSRKSFHIQNKFVEEFQRPEVDFVAIKNSIMADFPLALDSKKITITDALELNLTRDKLNTIRSNLVHQNALLMCFEDENRYIFIDYNQVLKGLKNEEYIAVTLQGDIMFYVTSIRKNMIDNEFILQHAMANM